MDAGQINILLNVVTVLFTGGVLGVFLRYRQGMRGLGNADKADIRDHYAEELARVVDRQHKCEEREHRLRERVAELENDILGLIRIITQASADKVLDLGAEVPKHIRDMAERVKDRAFQARESDKPLG